MDFEIYKDLNKLEEDYIGGFWCLHRVWGNKVFYRTERSYKWGIQNVNFYDFLAGNQSSSELLFLTLLFCLLSWYLHGKKLGIVIS